MNFVVANPIRTPSGKRAGLASSDFPTVFEVRDVLIGLTVVGRDTRWSGSTYAPCSEGISHCWIHSANPQRHASQAHRKARARLLFQWWICSWRKQTGVNLAFISQTHHRSTTFYLAGMSVKVGRAFDVW